MPRLVLALSLVTTSLAADKAADPNLPTCDAQGVAARGPAQTRDDGIRDAAQKGLDFLSTSAVSWQGKEQCYGCHVQSVTLQAMAVGRHHDYVVDDRDLHAIVRGITELPGGTRTPGGLRWAHGTYFSAARSLGGSALARYDAWVSTDLREDLLQTAEQLRGMQHADGYIVNDYTSAPVASGVLQDTVLAMVTWNQAYARTADDQWLTAVGRAEDWLSGQVGGVTDLQQVNYALMGLMAADSTASEGTTSKLVKSLIDRQNDDGGWSLVGGASDAYATGQTLYTLRLMGFTETDPAIGKGTKWLVSHQGADGGWSHSGRERAEGMWAVLGLVSVDVLTLQVAEIEDGQHVSGDQKVYAAAFDNQGGRVVQVQMSVDDVPVKRTCGNQLQWTWGTAGLSSGPHIVDLVATNAAGKTARRRLTVYAGDHYLTRVGSRYEDGGTTLSFRNLYGKESTIRLSILGVAEKDGREVPGEVLASQERPGQQGGMRFWWDGKGKGGAAMPSARYFARLELVDAAGKVRHTEQTVFVHDTPAAQAAAYGQIGGQLRLDGGGGANTTIQLVDDRGVVVEETVTTDEGQYRFRNVKAGKYKVRVSKDGWGDDEAPVEAAPAAAAESVDLDL